MLNKYKQEQQRLREEINRIEDLVINNKRKTLVLSELREDLNLSFKDWRIRELSRDNVRGVGF